MVTKIIVILIFSILVINPAAAYNPTFNGKYIVCADGHRINMINNAKSHNPTYQELIYAIKKDQTDKIAYKEGVFTCGDFAERVHNNLEKTGIRSGIVRLDYRDKSINHAVNVFKTTDKGIVYISCISEDKIGKFEIGKERIYTPLGGKSYTADGIIKTITVYW
jgi:hypothetical protein